ncbi:MAG: four helix bundle protein [Pseudomonadota bacterium]
MSNVVQYSDLSVWQKAMNLVEEIYRLTRSFPKEEQFGLVSQMRRAAISIPSNIAEGYGRKSTKAYVNYLSISYGSLLELETQIQIGQRLLYLDRPTMEKLLVQTNEVGRMLNGLQQSLTRQSVA